MTSMERARPARFLRGENVYLRPIEAEDAEWYFQSLYDDENRKLTGTQLHYTREQIANYIAGKAQDRSGVLLLIAANDTDEPIGDVALQNIDAMNRSANVRIALNPGRTGRGYGSEAMRLMLDYGFGIVNLHRIELNVFAYNERAIRAYEKLGFRREGVQREALYYDHEYHDSILMSMLAREYRELYLRRG
ncbi:GNAT family N-acetyltransferase [Paenibacillus antri]|uniref:GNAT family N-acetyltransferase n=1 Tax=Paenibacillus antri TaxID=2582848 RepID=A0A5R9GHK5_9BACL|nr:GNAT family protein [Paenibacillus antri]TLS53956.1 GNAT family N-acetyltransferase [Paenibacillus antri]